MPWLTKLREWIDGENLDPKAIQPEHDIFTPIRRTSQDFLVYVARNIDQVLQRETFVTPKGTTFAPREFRVLFSPQDHRAWQEQHKLAGLLRWLQEVFEERITQITTNPERSISFTIRVQADEQLREGQVQVIPVWQTTEEPNTSATTSFPYAQRSVQVSSAHPEEQEAVYICRLPEHKR